MMPEIWICCNESFRVSIAIAIGDHSLIERSRDRRTQNVSVSDMKRVHSQVRDRATFGAVAIPLRMGQTRRDKRKSESQETNYDRATSLRNLRRIEYAPRRT
jgi:hypothetical protein